MRQVLILGLVALLPFLGKGQDVAVPIVPIPVVPDALTVMQMVDILTKTATESKMTDAASAPSAVASETVMDIAGQNKMTQTDMMMTSGDVETAVTLEDVTNNTASASRVSPVLAKRDLQASATGFGGIGGIGGGIGGGHVGGFGGGYGGGAGFGGGYGGNQEFGGGKKVGGGSQFGADYGGVNKNIKLIDDKHSNSQYGSKGVKGNQGFSSQQGHAKVDLGKVNKAQKKGQFGSVGQFSKGAKNDGTVYGNNNVATKFSKGTRFGNKGAHKKGHNTKGFHNTHHKDEYQKNHQFHDDKNDVSFFDKFGDEGAFNNNLAGKQFFNGHNSNVFNKNNQANAGEFLDGHHNVVNKGNNDVYGKKGHLSDENNFAQYGGQNFASGIGKGIHSNNNYGGQYGGGGFKKNGGFGGGGHQGGFQGGVGGGYGHGGGGYGHGIGGIGGGIGY